MHGGWLAFVPVQLGKLTTNTRRVFGVNASTKVTLATALCFFFYSEEGLTEPWWL